MPTDQRASLRILRGADVQELRARRGWPGHDRTGRREEAPVPDVDIRVDGLDH